jgi:hypothetical protein
MKITKKMEPDAGTAIDGSLDHHRNTGTQIVDVIGCRLGRIVDFEIVVQKANFHKGDFEGANSSDDFNHAPFASIEKHL